LVITKGFYKGFIHLLEGFYLKTYLYRSRGLDFLPTWFTGGYLRPFGATLNGVETTGARLKPFLERGVKRGNGPLVKTDI